MGSSSRGAGRAVRWTRDNYGGWELAASQGSALARVRADLVWAVYYSRFARREIGRAPTLEDAKAAVEAVLWARAAEGLAGR